MDITLVNGDIFVFGDNVIDSFSIHSKGCSNDYNVVEPLLIPLKDHSIYSKNLVDFNRNFEEITCLLISEEIFFEIREKGITVLAFSPLATAPILVESIVVDYF